MKYKLEKPQLNGYELAKLNFLATYFGYNLKYKVCDNNCYSALFEDEDNKRVAYVQKDRKLFIIWNHNESIQYVDDLMNIILNIDKLINVVRKKKEKAEWLIGFLKINNFELSWK
jgi:hypothetical protein